MAISIDDIRKATCKAIVEGSSTFRPDQIRAYERAIERKLIRNLNGYWRRHWRILR